MDEQQLAAIEALAPELDPWVIDPELVLRLVAEVRRLQAENHALRLAYNGPG